MKLFLYQSKAVVHFLNYVYNYSLQNLNERLSNATHEEAKHHIKKEMADLKKKEKEEEERKFSASAARAKASGKTCRLVSLMLYD